MELVLMYLKWNPGATLEYIPDQPGANGESVRFAWHITNGVNTAHAFTINGLAEVLAWELNEK
jgi:hypothetical protein